MGAAFAGVFCGVLVVALLEVGTFMVVVAAEGCAGVKIVWRGEEDLRSSDGVHLLIADRLRHLGSGSGMSLCGWQLLSGGSGVVGASTQKCSAAGLRR
jgi:hypothetical protein